MKNLIFLFFIITGLYSCESCNFGNVFEPGQQIVVHSDTHGWRCYFKIGNSGWHKLYEGKNVIKLCEIKRADSEYITFKSRLDEVELKIEIGAEYLCGVANKLYAYKCQYRP